MAVRIASAGEAIDCEKAAMLDGTSSLELMCNAGIRAADFIRSRFGDLLAAGVAVYTGAGNNGGDGWVVAESLAKSGITVHVVEVLDARTPEAMKSRAAAIAAGAALTPSAPPRAKLIVDALLGTGANGKPRGEIAHAIQTMQSFRQRAGVIVALDVPSGLDATTGIGEGSVQADATIAFGLLKRGALIARERCGEIVVVDIGLGHDVAWERLPLLVDHDWAHGRIPPIAVSANKGTRKQVAIVGGRKGMAGAAILAGEGALRSGVGLLRVVCAEDSRLAVHASIPAAIVQPWPESAGDVHTLIAAVDCMAIGPGMGNDSSTRDLVETILLAGEGPVVIDADALNVFAADVASLATLLRRRPAVLTPHPGEMARLLGTSIEEVLDNRFDIGTDLAKSTGAAVLLKGSPTVVFAPNGDRLVVAAGTAALATGGSGDVLSGMIATLLAQLPDGPDRSTHAAGCAAFIHGRAAELCRLVRGTTLDDIIRTLPAAWNERPVARSSGSIALLERQA
ncbi:MAG: NAD(P)H-hydrate dehydratase [Gemmatimonadaceae bacterium]